MIVVRVAFNVKPEDKPTLLREVETAVPRAHEFEGCKAFGFYEDAQTENAYLLYEEWETQAHFDAYRTSEHFKESGAVLFPLIVGAPSTAYFAAETLPS